MTEMKAGGQQSGGVNVEGGSVSPRGDVVGRDKITQNITNVPAEKITALYQLPPPTADFTGRADDLVELLAAINTQGVAITGMHGMGGVGKTALALKLADQLRDRYPDGQIYLDLKGIEKSPLLPKEAMAHVIRSFDLTAKPPESEAEVIGLYRSVLHGRRVLLLMDNAKDEQQIRPLVPPDGSLLIVTSRQHFTLPGLFDKNLDVMSPKDAQELLCRIAPRLKKEKSATVEELACLCGFLPLALETVASALKIRVNIGPTEYAERLKDARERLKLTAADASLELSYQLLPEGLQGQFRKLAVFPHTFYAAAAAAVWEAEPAIAQDALGEMLLYSLVEFNQATRRYRLHDLVRLFADNRLSAKERESSHQRHAGHYLQVLGAADRLFLKGGDSVLNGLALFDTEWGNIQVGQTWVARHAKDDRSIAEWCAAYPDAGVRCLSLRQHPREGISWLESALNATRALKNRAAEAGTLGHLGNSYHLLAEYRLSIEYFEQALVMSRETGNREAEGSMLGNLGVAYKNLGQHRRAIEYYERSLAISREVSDKTGEATALGNLGVTYGNLGEYRRAIEYYEKSLAISRGVGTGEATALGNLGVAYKNLGDYHTAIKYFEQALVQNRQIGDRRAEGNTLCNLGVVYQHLNEQVSALNCHEHAVKIHREVGDARGEEKNLGNIGILLAIKGDHNAASSYYKEQLKIARYIGDRVGEAGALFNNGLSLDVLGDRIEAIACLDAALKIFEEIESPHAAKVRDQLAKWRKEEKAKGQADE